VLREIEKRKKQDNKSLDVFPPAGGKTEKQIFFK
jgi:hypothetical protein